MSAYQRKLVTALVAAGLVVGAVPALAIPASTTTIGANLSTTGSLTVGGDVNVQSGRLFIDDVDGYVGIGTVAPDTDLHVLGETDEHAYISVESQGTAFGESGIVIETPENIWYLYADDSTHDNIPDSAFAIYSEDIGRNVMSIGGNGLVTLEHNILFASNMNHEIGVVQNPDGIGQGLQISAGTASNGVGESNGGGDLALFGGNGGNDTSANGGNGGDVEITGGNGGTGTPSGGLGGNILIMAGQGGSTAADGAVKIVSDVVSLRSFNASSVGLLQLGSSSGAPVHLSSVQQSAPTATAAGPWGGSMVGGASNTDTRGTLEVAVATTNNGTVGLVFSKPYATAPKCVVSPSSAEAAGKDYYVSTSTTGMTLHVVSSVTASTNVAWDYFCMQ